MNLTEKEKALLEGIFKSHYHDSRYPIESPVWPDAYDFNFFPVKSMPGVMASLSKKGLVDTDGETVHLTQAAATLFPTEEEYYKMTRQNRYDLKIK